VIDDRRVAGGLLALTFATLLSAVSGVDGPVAGAVSLVFVLVAPGLALSLPMGPMSVEARLLVSVAGSAALATVTALLLLAAGRWSGGLGLAVLATIVILLAGRAVRLGPHHPPDPPQPPVPDHPDPNTNDLPEEITRRTP